MWLFGWRIANAADESSDSDSLSPWSFQREPRIQSMPCKQHTAAKAKPNWIPALCVEPLVPRLAGMTIDLEVQDSNHPVNRRQIEWH